VKVIKYSVIFLMVMQRKTVLQKKERKRDVSVNVDIGLYHQSFLPSAPIDILSSCSKDKNCRPNITTVLTSVYDMKQ